MVCLDNRFIKYLNKFTKSSLVEPVPLSQCTNVQHVLTHRQYMKHTTNGIKEQGLGYEHLFTKHR